MPLLSFPFIWHNLKVFISRVYTEDNQEKTYPGLSPAIVVILVAVGHDMWMWKSGEVAVRKETVTWTVVYLWLMACDEAFSHQPMLNLVEICIVTTWGFFFPWVLASSTNILPPPHQ